MNKRRRFKAKRRRRAARYWRDMSRLRFRSDDAFELAWTMPSRPATLYAVNDALYLSRLNDPNSWDPWPLLRPGVD